MKQTTAEPEAGSCGPTPDVPPWEDPAESTPRQETQ